MTEGLLTILRKCTGLKRLEVHGWFMQNINDRCVLLLAALLQHYGKCRSAALSCMLQTVLCMRMSMYTNHWCDSLEGNSCCKHADCTAAVKLPDNNVISADDLSTPAAAHVLL
jgi:hypothetical protein